MRSFRVALIAALLLAGCAAPAADEATPAAVSPTVIVTDDRPEPVAGDVALGPSAGPDLNATLAAAPRLVEGEWWKVRLKSSLDGTDATFVRVVAEDAGDAYVFGMPHDGWWKEAVVYHMPFFGEVAKDGEGNAHDIPFLPVKFPLTDETTWETNFENEETLTATVKTSPDQTAEVTFKNADGATRVILTYDAKMHEITKFWVNYMEFEVVDHGYGFEGWVTVPRGEDLVFLNGRVGPALDVGLQPAPPTETVEIAGGFNRVTFIIAVGGASTFLGAPADGPGVFKLTATAPDGTKYELQQGPEPGTKIQFFENAAPDGAWSLEHIAAGAGVSFIEGIAYHQYDVKLETQPDGSVQNVAIRSDHSHEVIR